jgi:hypothetical protein
VVVTATETLLMGLASVTRKDTEVIAKRNSTVTVLTMINQIVAVVQVPAMLRMETKLVFVYATVATMVPIALLF